MSERSSRRVWGQRSGRARKTLCFWRLFSINHSLICAEFYVSVFTYCCFVNRRSGMACTAQNYEKITFLSVVENVINSRVSNVVHARLFDVDVAVCRVEVGVSHARPDEISLNARRVKHGSVRMSELPRVQLG